MECWLRTTLKSLWSRWYWDVMKCNGIRNDWEPDRTTIRQRYEHVGRSLTDLAHHTRMTSWLMKCPVIGGSKGGKGVEASNEPPPSSQSQKFGICHDDSTLIWYGKLLFSWWKRPPSLQFLDQLLFCTVKYYIYPLFEWDKWHFSRIHLVHSNVVYLSRHSLIRQAHQPISWSNRMCHMAVFECHNK